MKLSIVIVSYNVRYFLEQCLQSLRPAIARIQAEIFVVDNCSSDDSLEMLRKRFPEVKLIANQENVGFAKANNQAIRQSLGEYVLLLNPDTVLAEDALDLSLAFMDAHPEAGGLGARMINGYGSFLPESKRGMPTPFVSFCKIFGLSYLFPKSKIFGRYHLGFLDEHETHPVEILAGAYMMMRKSVLDKVGLLDETFFMYGEDIDLSYRMIEAGYRNYYFPEACMLHYKGESTKKASMRYIRVFYHAMIIFAEKHYHGHFLWLYSSIIHLAIYFRAAIAAISIFFNGCRRALSSLFGKKKSAIEKKNILVWGNSDEENAVVCARFLHKTKMPVDKLIFVADKETPLNRVNLNEVASIIRDRHIREMIFIEGEIQNKEMLALMEQYAEYHLDYRIAHLEEDAFLVGSNTVMKCNS